MRDGVEAITLVVLAHDRGARFVVDPLQRMGKALECRARQAVEDRERSEQRDLRDGNLCSLVDSDRQAGRTRCRPAGWSGHWGSRAARPSPRRTRGLTRTSGSSPSSQQRRGTRRSPPRERLRRWRCTASRSAESVMRSRRWTASCSIVAGEVRPRSAPLLDDMHYSSRRRGVGGGLSSWARPACPSRGTCW